MPSDPLPGYDPPGMDPELKARLKESYGRTRDREVANAALTLDAVRDQPERQGEAVLADAHRLLDNLIAASPARPQHQCASGCSWCCHQSIRIAAVEAIAIAEALREAYPSDWLAAIRRVLEVRAAAAAGFADARAYRAAGLPCAFLGPEGQCAVYEWRPLVCRSYHSLSRAACQEQYVDLRAPTPPIDAYTHLSGNAVLHGMALAVDAAGRDGGLYELHGAVLRALDTTDARGRWGRGESLFRGVLRGVPEA
jgi:Fe-S-cluster containining protein